MITGCLPYHHHHHRKHAQAPPPETPEEDKVSAVSAADNPPPKVEEKKKSRRTKSFFGVLSLQRHSDKKSNTDDGDQNPKAAAQQEEIGLSPPAKAASAGDLERMDQPLSPPRSPSLPSIIDISGGDCGNSTSLSEFISDSIIYNSNGEEAEEGGGKVAAAPECADEAIDSKADEFIAQFYHQIQIQNTYTIPSGEFSREFIALAPRVLKSSNLSQASEPNSAPRS